MGVNRISMGWTSAHAQPYPVRDVLVKVLEKLNVSLLNTISQPNKLSLVPKHE